MQKFIEAVGKTEEAALASALAQLGLDRDEVSVEVLERAKSGFLGLGGNPARIKVTYEVPDQPESPATRWEAEIQPAAQREEKPAQAEPIAQKEPETSASEEKAKQIQTFLVGLMAHMDVKAFPRVMENPEGGYKVIMVGEGLGALIGRRGETLDAIQQLTNYAINRGQAKRVRIQIDAEHYRAKREESLQRLAQKVADKVVKYRRNVTLEPMNAYERHVIHAALQDYPGVTTYSTGTEPNRRTVVAYDPAGRN